MIDTLVRLFDAVLESASRPPKTVQALQGGSYQGSIRILRVRYSPRKRPDQGGVFHVCYLMMMMPYRWCLLGPLISNLSMHMPPSPMPQKASAETFALRSSSTSNPPAQRQPLHKPKELI